jgi:hypothetical protein
MRAVFKRAAGLAPLEYWPITGSLFLVLFCAASFMNFFEIESLSPHSGRMSWQCVVVELACVISRIASCFRLCFGSRELYRCFYYIGFVSSCNLDDPV